MRKVALLAVALLTQACSSRLESASDQVVRLPDGTTPGAHESSARAPSAWVAAATHESHEVADIELAYYTVHMPSARASETLSRRLREWALANAAAVEEAAKDAAAEPELPPLPRFSLKVACDPKIVSDDFISIVCAVDAYEGGAHGSYGVETFNYAIDGDDVRAIGLDDLFLDAKAGRDFVSDVCMKELAAQSAMWISEGDVTDVRDMVDTFHVENKAIVVHFAPYAVGPYAEGEHTVEIPLAKLRGLRPDIAGRIPR
jgi:hypothetical protein